MATEIQDKRLEVVLRRGFGDLRRAPFNVRQGLHGMYSKSATLGAPKTNLAWRPGTSWDNS